MRISTQLQTGKAGEYIVCADLILKGFVAFPSEQGLPYDVLLDTGERIFRVQVKTTLAPRVIPQRDQDNPTKAYIFNVKRCGKKGMQRHGSSDLDIFALVCLDTKRVGYLIGDAMPDTLNIRVDALRGNYYDEKGIADYIRAMELAKTMSKAEIARSMRVSLSAVYRMLQRGFKPHETQARYFSDIERDREWFSTL